MDKKLGYQHFQTQLSPTRSMQQLFYQKSTILGIPPWIDPVFLSCAFSFLCIVYSFECMFTGIFITQSHAQFYGDLSSKVILARYFPCMNIKLNAKKLQYANELKVSLANIPVSDPVFTYV